MENKRFKKKVIFSAAASAALTVSMSGCITGCVYGPPPVDPANSESSSAAVESDTSDNRYDPSDNMNEDVYGPPEWFGVSDGEPSDEEEDIDAPEIESSDEEISFDPEDNSMACVYGPPEMFD